jgi:serine protease Do
VKYAYSVTSALLLGGAAATLLTGFPAGAQVAQNEPAQVAQIAPRAGAPSSFAALTAQLQPAVVNISTKQKVRVAGNNPFAGTPFEGLFGGGGSGPQTREAQALGSGFVISADGYVVTNNHVITMDNQGLADSVTVTFPNGDEFPAKIVGRDQASDIAVLKVDAGKSLPFVRFGKSAESRVGDWVIAIGNPFGLGGTVTAGIISSVNRNTGSGAYDHYIQTDASINSGNSGGPMFDMSGNVIGINNWIIAPGGGNIGIGFAIPSDIAAPLVEKLRNGRAIERGYLGIQVQPVTDDLAASLGLSRKRGEFVQSTESGKPAAQAGILPGDVVVKIDGQEVTADNSLSSIIANTAPGKRIPIELVRGGRPLTVTATVGRRPSEEELAQRNFSTTPTPGQGQAQQPPETGSSVVAQALGISAIPLTPEIAARLGVSEGTRGMVITQVDPNSDAGTKRLQRGMIILSAGGQTVTTQAEFEAVVRAARTDRREAVLLRVQPPGQAPVFVPVRLR